jgi:predicted site-specific integrase-resolvase
MKLSQYAKKQGIHYTTAYRLWKNGHLKGKQLPTGTIVIDEEHSEKRLESHAVLYARVSSSENKSNLDAQLSRLRSYAAARGYTIVKEIKAVGSGLNDKRPLLEKVFDSENWNILVVEHKDRLARFGTNYISLLLKKQGKTLEIINQSKADETEDLMQDFVAIITSFTARLYGLRRSKRKTEVIIKQLQELLLHSGDGDFDTEKSHKNSVKE